MNMLFYSGVHVQNQITATCLSLVPSGSEDFPANEFLYFFNFRMADGVLEIYFKKLDS